jgi:hypothetical protein
VTCLDDPAAGLPVGLALLQLDLLTARADVRGEAVIGEQLADRVGVVGAVEADPLRLRFGRLGALDRDRLDRRR